MKRKLIAIFALSLAATIAPKLRAEDSPPADGAMKHHDHAAMMREMESADMPAPTDASLFNVSSQWENSHGHSAALSQLAGKPHLVAMVYTSCQYACPRIVADLKAIESQFTSSEQEKIGICLVTIDPQRDTVEAYHKYADTQELDPVHWEFLRGAPGDILELANLLGVKYKQLPDGEYSHSNIITLLNAKGEVVTQLVGLGADNSEIVAAAKALL